VIRIAVIATIVIEIAIVISIGIEIDAGTITTTGVV
jgi:hypothetical protein